MLNVEGAMLFLYCKWLRLNLEDSTLAPADLCSSGLIEPCLPQPAKAPPTGPGWLHENKHDGFRIIARRDSLGGVRLITRKGHDFSTRFPVAAAPVGALLVRSCVIDGEAIVCDETGLAVFELIRRRHSHLDAVLCAFDLLELNAGRLMIPIPPSPSGRVSRRRCRPKG
jgi:ATP-dependent DNA ligase